jgi:hypothetical protein
MQPVIHEREQDPRPLEIAKMLILSTAHVTLETSQRLPDGIEGLIAYEKGEYGWLIYVNAPHVVPLPADLQGVRDLARNHGCEWVMLDRDGDVIDALPSYDWEESANVT